MVSEDLELQLEQLVLHDGDVFLLHFPQGVDNDRLSGWVAELDSWLDRQGRPDVRFICVPRDVSIEMLSEGDLKRLGLRRVR